MDENKSAARKAAIEWWRNNAHINAKCDGRRCGRSIPSGQGYLCQSLTFGDIDLVCESCYDEFYHPHVDTASHQSDDIVNNQIKLERELNEALKSIGLGTHVVNTIIVTDDMIPRANHICDHEYFIGEIYLRNNQSALAANRYEKALSAYNGQSDIEYFDYAVKSGLAEAYSAIDFKQWDKALKYLDEILEKYQDDDLALVIKARIYARQNKPIEAYNYSIKALKENPNNFEAACYLGLMGAHLARAEKNPEEMKKSAQNLKIAMNIYSSPKLQEMIEFIEEEAETM